MKNRLYSKTSVFLTLSIFVITNSFAQDCSQATAQISLNANNVNAKLLVGGDLWWDGSDGGYVVPKPEPGDPELSLISGGGIWMGGYDTGGSLKLAAQTYGTSGGASDYWPGPLNESGTQIQEICTNFDRFWSANNIHNQAHIADWGDNGIIDGPVPNSILAWPGDGNPEFSSINGFDLPTNNQGGLAPFFDQNGNGSYEPMLGDYPEINEASEAVWWVFNDAGNIHTQTGGDQLKFETQVLAYSYTSNNPNIDNATFYDYKFINKAAESLDSTFIGIWVDFDIDCFFDDYMGCDTTQNLVYAYNSWEVPAGSDCSQNCSGSSNPTYCSDIHIIGLKILEGVKGMENNELVDRGMSSFIYYNNPGLTPSPLSGTTDPSTGVPHQFYNYLTGSWRDGTRMTKGGDGYDPSSTDYTNYAFPCPPNEADGWSMCSENMPDQDRRAVIGSGPFNIQPGGTNTLSFAVIYAQNIEYPCPSLDPLTDAANDVEDLFKSLVGTSEILATYNANIKLQPNPMVDQSALIFKELENEVTQVSIFSIDGKMVQDYSNVSGSSLTIERGNLNSGIYFYKLLTKDFKIHSGKFIVQ